MTPRRALLPLLFALALAAPAHASILYSCGGDICAAADNGSNPAKVTTDGKTANYHHPTVSADGRTLALTSNDGTVLLDPVTHQRTVVSGDYSFNLALSPDGKTLADNTGMCDCAYHSIVCVYAVANTGQKLCDTQAQPPASGLAFGPDGRLYSAQNGQVCRRAAAQATCEQTVVADPARKVTTFDVSPDGKRIVAATSAGIAVYDLASGALQAQLTSVATDADPAWSANGASVIFTRGDSTHRDLYETAKPGGEQLLIPGGQEAVTAPTLKHADPGLQGFAAKADGSGVAGKVLIPIAGSELRVAFKDGLGKLVKDDLPAGKRTFRLGLDKKGRRRLHKHGSLKVTVKVTVTPPAGGQPASATKQLVLKG